MVALVITISFKNFILVFQNRARKTFEKHGPKNVLKTEQNRNKLFIPRIYEFLKWTSSPSAACLSFFGGGWGSVLVKLVMKGPKLCSTLLLFAFPTFAPPASFALLMDIVFLYCRRTTNTCQVFIVVALKPSFFHSYSFTDSMVVGEG